MTRRLVAVAVLAATLMAAAPAGATDAPMAISAPSPVRSLQQAVRVTPPAPQASPAASPAHEAVAILNAERAAHGLAPLQIDDRLMLAAQRHSADQAAMGAMSHTGSDGSNVGTRLQRVGFGYSRYAENVAHGYGSAASVVAAWMASPGHRANNLNVFLTHIGVGLAHTPAGHPYWTMVFATPG
jgi:uncharacterized protein YkwD